MAHLQENIPCFNKHCFMTTRNTLKFVYGASSFLHLPTDILQQRLKKKPITGKAILFLNLRPCSNSQKQVGRFYFAGKQLNFCLNLKGQSQLNRFSSYLKVSITIVKVKFEYSYQYLSSFIISLTFVGCVQKMRLVDQLQGAAQEVTTISHLIVIQCFISSFKELEFLSLSLSLSFLLLPNLDLN